LKEEALDRLVWRPRYGPVVRQTTGWVSKAVWWRGLHQRAVWTCNEMRSQFVHLCADIDSNSVSLESQTDMRYIRRHYTYENIVTLWIYSIQNSTKKKCEARERSVKNCVKLFPNFLSGMVIGYGVEWRGRRRVDGREKSKVVCLWWAWREELRRLRRYIGLCVEEAAASWRRVRLRDAGVVGMDVPRRTSTSYRHEKKKHRPYCECESSAHHAQIMPGQERNVFYAAGTGIERSVQVESYSLYNMQQKVKMEGT
jgi:hypothetical protein